MSKSIRTAWIDPRENNLTKEASRRRPLFSSFDTLFGSSVIALAVLPQLAQAKSPLDEMAWAPASMTSPKVFGNGAVAAALRPVDPRNVLDAVDLGEEAPRESAVVNSVANVGASATATVAATRPMNVSQAKPVVSRGFASAGLISPDEADLGDEAPRTSAVARPVAHTVANAPSVVAAPRGIDASQAQPVISRGFANAGLIASDDADPVAAAPVVKAPPVQKAVALPAAPNMAASPIRPSLLITPQRDMQSDLIAMRSAVAGGGNASADDAGTIRPAVNAALPLRKAVSVPKASRNAHSKDQTYADWLDDSAAAKALGDRSVVPERAVRLALRNAADVAATRSPAIRQARNDWDAAKFDVDQVKGQRWPQVQLTGNSPSLQGSNNSFNDSNMANASINVTTMVYDWGKTKKNIDSRTKTAEAAEFYMKTMEQQNAYDVSTNLVELAKNRAIYSIGESYVRRMGALVDMLAEIVKVDPGRLSELSQAKARLLQAQTSQAVVAAQVRSLELSVRKLAGDEPTPMPAGTLWQLQLDGLDDAVAAVPQNPAIEQAMAESAAAAATAKSVRAASLPQLNWVINKTTAHDSFNQRQPWTTMLQLSWTPFQGGSQQAAERAALSRASSSADKREQLELDSEFRVRDAHRDAIALATRAKLYGELTVETDLVRKQFFEQWYHLNRRTLVDVLLAESDFYNNQVSQVTTQFDAYQAILKIRLNNGTLEQWLQDA
jgi:outer membrane protein, adhesin transport system